MLYKVAVTFPTFDEILECRLLYTRGSLRSLKTAKQPVFLSRLRKLARALKGKV